MCNKRSPSIVVLKDTLLERIKIFVTDCITTEEEPSL